MSGASARTKQLLNLVMRAEPEVFAERALIVTKAYQESEGKPYEIRQASALAAILNEYPVTIRDGELIVGVKTVKPFGSPVYPEVSCEWLEEELDNLPTRREQPFRVSEEVKKELRKQVFPYWREKTVHAKLLEALPRNALDAHNAGALFHYYLDRSIGHLVADYEKVLQSGLNGLKQEGKPARGGHNMH